VPTLGKFAELERQQIFFAERSKLNDPLEGLKSLFWLGDAVLWENLFRHYIGCFYYAACVLVIAGEDHPIGWQHVPLSSPLAAARTPLERELIEELTSVFLSHEAVKSLIEVLGKRKGPIRANELRAYLVTLHPLAIFEVLALLRQRGLFKGASSPEAHAEVSVATKRVVQLATLSESLDLETDGHADAREAIFAVQTNVSRQLDLVNRYNLSHGGSAANRAFALFDFPHDYPEKLEQLVYPEFYTACFSATYANSSVWGHYGDGHRGACLIFNAEAMQGHNAIALRRLVSEGAGGPIQDIRHHIFYPVRYQGVVPEADFFGMLGMLTVPTINAEWYHTRDKVRTSRADCTLDPREDRLRSHWEGFERYITTKSNDWAYEEELRLTWHSAVFDLSDDARRVTTYDFKSLHGIAFGIKTSAEDKIEIMRIIDQKCADMQRRDFKFYQAYYAPETATIKLAELGLIKFSQS